MDSALAFAEAALARGDYNKCLTVLEPLAEEYPINSQEGPKIRLLIVTAWMGKGDDQKAISICRELTRCKDNDLRQTSKQLLSVLESPSLARPANWSIQLPNLDLTPQTGSNFYKAAKKSKDTKSLPLPPTGPTRDLGLGFSTLALIVLTVLTILLSGCVKITTEIAITGPDRIKLNWEIESITKQLLPWQIEFEDSLKHLNTNIEVSSNSEGEQKIKTPILRSKEAHLILQQTFTTAAKSAGFEMSPPILSLKEKNWLIGVQQELQLVVNLKDLPAIPGLKLLMLIKHVDNKSFAGSPIGPTLENNHLNWQVKQGEINTLTIRTWRWNQLGIGVLLIITLLGLNLVLQRIRLKMGFGFPELPP